MNKNTVFILAFSLFVFGLNVGIFFTMLIKGIGSNSGSKFYGSEFAGLLGKTGGIGNNSGSEFFSDKYIEAKFKAERAEK